MTGWDPKLNWESSLLSGPFNIMYFSIGRKSYWVTLSPLSVNGILAVCTKCVRPAHFNSPTWYAPPVLSWAWPSAVACLPQAFSWYPTPKEGFILHLHICFSCMFVLRRFLNWVCSWYFWKVDTIVQVRTSSTACAPQALAFLSIRKACVAFRPWAAVSLLHHFLSSSGLASSIQFL